MLLVKFYINGTPHLLSNEYLDLPEGFYDGYIASFTQFRIATKKPYGGLPVAEYGQVDFLPIPFTDPGNWPPPTSGRMEVSVGTRGTSETASFPGSQLIDEGGDSPTDGTGVLVDDGASLGIIANPTTIERILTGTAHLFEPSRDSVKYDLYGPEYTTTVTDAHYTGTLREVFAAACVTLGLAFDYTHARNPSPQVDYRAEGEQLLTDNLSAMAEFFTHKAPIENGTLYLIDNFINAGLMELTESDVFPSTYPAPAPLKRVTATYPAEILQYRLVITANGGATVCCIAELQMRLKPDGFDISPTGTPSASNYAGINTPARAVDDDDLTFWLSTTGPGEDTWFQMSWNTARDIVEYTLKAPTLNFARMPVEWKVQGYDVETSAWRTIKEEKTENNWTAGEVRKFSITRPNWDVIVRGSSPYCDNVLSVSPVCHTERDQIKAALRNIKTYMEMYEFQIVKPLTPVPKIGQGVTHIDESMPVPTALAGRVSEVIYDFDNHQCIAKGKGTISAI